MPFVLRHVCLLSPPFWLLTLHRHLCTQQQLSLWGPHKAPPTPEVVCVRVCSWRPVTAVWSCAELTGLEEPGLRGVEFSPPSPPPSVSLGDQKWQSASADALRAADDQLPMQIQRWESSSNKRSGADSCHLESPELSWKPSAGVRKAPNSFFFFLVKKTPVRKVKLDYLVARCRQRNEQLWPKKKSNKLF